MPVPRERMISRKVTGYIITIAALATLALVTGTVRSATGWDWQNIAIWSFVCVLSELLWLQTISGEGTIAMASAFNLAVIILLGWERALWIVGASTLFANLAIQKKEWYKAVFNTGQSILTVALAGLVYQGLGGDVLMPEPGFSRPIEVASFMSRFRDLGLVIPFVASGFTYHMVNTLLVSEVIALSSRQGLLSTWRKNYGYTAETVSSLALLFLAPLVVLSYGAISFAGIVLFFVPLVFIRDSSQRYIQLQRTQDSLVRSERMVAKGEMAAEIGHELNNYLAAISGRAQMILMRVQPDADEKLRKSAEIIFENTANMAILTAGLMDAAHKETQMRPSLLNELIRKTVEFVRPQNKYDRIRFQLDLDESVPMGELDPGQIQQVLLNLFSNAADALHESGRTDKAIKVVTRFDAPKHLVTMTVSDNGPGMTAEVAARIFEPTYTTKEKGHGFGLSTSFRIVENHRGRIAVDTRPGEGATFTVNLPLNAA